ncbi:MAG TPA: IS91 family transposase [Spirochaetia bacterium]|nr:IS91 family transposase [Spirochaetia bacterium]
MQDLLPVSYFHVVFTVPRELNNLFLWNRRKMYSLLLKMVSRTIIDSADRNLGIQPGMLEVLHTWGQKLDFHPHVHCIVYGGGLSNNKWISSKKDFYIHVKKFSRLFRGKFLAALKKMSKSGGLRNPEKDPTPFSFEQFIPLAKEMYKKEWVVYSKKPFGGPEQVLKYLSRYTHRVAISNYRLKDISGGNITFTWKDYRTGKRKVMKLPAREFMRRFLLHVLPRGFVKIRCCGFLNNRIKKVQLAVCRKELGACQIQTAPVTIASDILENAKTNFTNRQTCPICKTGVLIMIKIKAFYENNIEVGCAPPCPA